MPQIDISTFLSQAFWLLVCFCTLWGILSVFIMPKLTDVIEQRKRKINDFVFKADQFRLRAEEALKAYTQTITKAKNISEKEIAGYREEMDAYLEKSEADLQAELNQKIAAHEASLEREKQLISHQADTLAQNLALDLVKKLGFIKITSRDIAKIADKEKSNG